MHGRSAFPEGFPPFRVRIPIPQTRDLTIGICEKLDLLYDLYGRYEGNRIPAGEWESTRRAFPEGNGRGAREANIRTALVTLGLLEGRRRTPLWHQVHGRGSQTGGKELLGKAILLDRGGWAFCYMLSVLPGHDRDSLWEYYREHFDPEIPDHLVNISQFNNLLVWLGVSDRRFHLDARRFLELTGVDVERLGGVGVLPRPSRYLLSVLGKLDPDCQGIEYPVKRLREEVFLQYRTHVNPHRFQSVLQPLLQAEMVQYRQVGAQQERGQTGMVRLNYEKARPLVVSGLAEALAGIDLEGDLASILSKSLADLVADLDTGDANDRGIALESLAVSICWRLGLRNIVVRDMDSHRGVEIDLTAERHEPEFGLFSIQCKNHEKKVGSPILMKELGVADMLGADTVVIFSRSGFEIAAEIDAREHASRFGRNVVLIEGVDLEIIGARSQDPAEAIWDIWTAEMEVNRRVRTGEPGLRGWMALFLREWARKEGLQHADWSEIRPQLESLGILRLALDHHATEQAWTMQRDIGER